MGIWDTLLEEGIKAGGAYLSASGDDDGGDKTTTSIQPVQPRTEGTASMSDFDILYNASAVQSMYNLTAKMDDWANQNRQFFGQVYQPYQEDLIQSNAALLPAIEKVASNTLEANARDLSSNTALKDAFRTSIAGVERQFSGQVDSLIQQIESVPTEQERVGQALAQVESQFGQAGKALTRDFQSRGQAVSQASKRDLEFQKARAKAGAAGAAGERARAEKLAATEKGIGVLAGKSAQSTQQLLGVQAGQQAGLATPQVGGVTPTSGFEGTQVAGDLAKAGAGQSFGTRQKQDQVTQVQKGTVQPALTSGAAGGLTTGSAQPGPVNFPGGGVAGATTTPVSGGAGANVVQGQPATNTTGQVIQAGVNTATQAANTMSNVVQGVISGGVNPR